jgi:hypothetical protein
MPAWRFAGFANAVAVESASNTIRKLKIYFEHKNYIFIYKSYPLDMFVVDN